MELLSRAIEGNSVIINLVGTARCPSDDISKLTETKNILILRGPSRSRKSTLAKFISSFVDPKRVQQTSLNEIGSPFGLARFVGMDLAICDDSVLSDIKPGSDIALNLWSIASRSLVRIDEQAKPCRTEVLNCKIIIIAKD